MTTRQQRHDQLKYIGFRVDTKARYRQAVRNFQRVKGLPVTGICDPVTQRKIAHAAELKHEGKHNLSKHFSFDDFICKCGGKYYNCQRFWLKRRLLVRLEKMVSVLGSFKPVSGCRCFGYNHSIGGATQSQHLVGEACDLPSRWTFKQIHNLHLFTGIGTGSRTGHVLHVDVRAGSVYSPIRWFYSGW